MLDLSLLTWHTCLSHSSIDKLKTPSSVEEGEETRAPPMLLGAPFVSSRCDLLGDPMNDDQVEEVCEGLGCSFGQAVSLQPATNSCRSCTSSMDLAAVGGLSSSRPTARSVPNGDVVRQCS